MNNKKKVFLGALAAVFVVGCVFGGQALADHIRATELEAYQAEQERLAKEEQAQKDAEASRNGHDKGTMDLIASMTAPSPSDAPPAQTPAPSDAHATETITIDQNGNVTITPDFASQINEQTNSVPRDAQAVSNMGGGGGDMEMDEYDVYHGEPSVTTPRPDSKPVPTPEAPQPSKEPESSGTTQTPAPTPTQTPASSGDTPPTYEGYEGEKNGKWEYWKGFGWLETEKMPKDDGGIGGDDSDMVTGGLSGIQVGTWG